MKIKKQEAQKKLSYKENLNFTIIKTVYKQLKQGKNKLFKKKEN